MNGTSTRAPTATRKRRGSAGVRGGTHRKLGGVSGNWPRPHPVYEIPVSEAAKRRREARTTCGRGKAPSYLIGRYKDGKRAIVFGLACKQRTCIRCGKLRRREVERKARLLVQRANGQCLFVTLTLGQPEDANPLTWWERFADMFKRWEKRMARFFRGSWKHVRYLWVMEPHKSGWPHMHIILTGIGFLHWKVVERHWKGVGGGGVDVARGDEDAAHYIGGYVGKQLDINDDLADYLTDNRVRWVASSEGLADKPKPSKWVGVQWTRVDACMVREHLVPMWCDDWDVTEYAIDLLYGESWSM